MTIDGDEGSGSGAGEAWYDPSSELSRDEQKQHKSDDGSSGKGFDQASKPIEHLSEASGIVVCVTCGIYWRNGKVKPHRAEFGHENCYMRRPAPPANRKTGWKDPYVLEENPALGNQGIVHADTRAAEDRRKRLKEDGHG